MWTLCFPFGGSNSGLGLEVKGLGFRLEGLELGDPDLKFDVEYLVGHIFPLHESNDTNKPWVIPPYSNCFCRGE